MAKTPPMTFQHTSLGKHSQFCFSLASLLELVWGEMVPWTAGANFMPTPLLAHLLGSPCWPGEVCSIQTCSTWTCQWEGQDASWLFLPSIFIIWACFLLMFSLFGRRRDYLWASLFHMTSCKCSLPRCTFQKGLFYNLILQSSLCPPSMPGIPGVSLFNIIVQKLWRGK